MNTLYESQPKDRLPDIFLCSRTLHSINFDRKMFCLATNSVLPRKVSVCSRRGVQTYHKSKHVTDKIIDIYERNILRQWFSNWVPWKRLRGSAKYWWKVGYFVRSL